MCAKGHILFVLNSNVYGKLGAVLQCRDNFLPVVEESVSRLEQELVTGLGASLVS